MTRIFGPRSFGPVEGDLASAQASWSSATDTVAGVRASIELAKLGDFSTREALLDLLVDGIADEGVHLDAQLLLLSIATSRIATDDRLIRYASTLDGRSLATFLGSGQSLLVRDAVPIYLGLAQAFEDAEEVRLSATDSVSMLTGVVFDEYDEDVTLEEYGTEAMDVVQRVEATYVIDGAPFVPASTAKLVTGLAMESHEHGRPFQATFALRLLATWSGIPNPSFTNPVPSEADVRAVVDYALELSRLPWRPGVKYFYGHDVDGGPGLHDAA